MNSSIEVGFSAIWFADAQGICTAIQENPAGLIPAMRGISLKAWLGSAQADTDEKIAAALAVALDEMMPFHFEVPVNCTDGEKRHLLLSGLPHSQSSSPQSRYQGFILDITAQRKMLEDALRTAAEYRLLVENSTDLIAHCGADGRYISVSPSYSRMIGWSVQELVGQLVVDFLHPEDRVQAAKALSAVFNGDVLPDVVEVRKRHRDGYYVVLGTKACGVSDPTTGNSIGAVLVSRDISSEKKRIKTLEEQAIRDDLTGLPNRTWIVEQVKRMLAEHEAPSLTTLLFIDLNGFKSVNDSLGHAAGDALLQQIGERLQRSKRPGDEVARLGGDEFVVAARCHSREEACAIAQRLLDGLSTPFAVSDLDVQIGASIGISIAGPETSSAMLFRNADIAMYQAKARNDGSYQFFDND